MPTPSPTTTFASQHAPSSDVLDGAHCIAGNEVRELAAYGSLRHVMAVLAGMADSEDKLKKLELGKEGR